MLTRQMIPVGRGGVSRAEGSQGLLYRPPHSWLSLEPWHSMSHVPPCPVHPSLKSSAACLSLSVLAALWATQGSCSHAYLTLLLLSSWLPWLSTALRSKFKCLNLAVKAFHYLHPEVLLALSSRTSKAQLPRSLFQAALPAFCPRQSHCSFFWASAALVPPLAHP